MSDSAYSSKRRNLTTMSSLDGNGLSLKSPLLATCWSFSFPGFGHFYINNFLIGMLLMTWEFAVNSLAKINLSIFYSLLGDFQMAKTSLNLRWFLGYGGVYVFCMWDSYIKTSELNKQYLLGYKDDKSISKFKMSDMGMKYLEKRNPWTSLSWSLIYPGLYTIYLSKIPFAILGFFLFGIVSYKACLFEGVVYSMLGDFDRVKVILDPQWLLYLPSMYGFLVYEAYAEAVEYNRVFKMEQQYFLRDNYQNKSFKMPL